MKILITGIASGIGRAIGDVFLRNNHKVFGIDLNDAIEKDNLITFKGDITNKESLINIKEYLINNNIELDMIINVAGIHKMASLIENNFDDIKSVIDINLCGTMLVNNVFHTILNENGKIVIITSEVASFDPLPFNGLYSISKVALESYAQALRQELNLLGQKVITIQPGAIQTPLANGSLTSTERLANETVLYKRQAKNFLNITKKFMGKPIATEKLAKFIYKKAIKKNPKYTYKIHHNLGLKLLSILPKRLQCFVVKLLVNK